MSPMFMLVHILILGNKELKGGYNMRCYPPVPNKGLGSKNYSNGCGYTCDKTYKADIGAEICIEGEGIRAMLAEMFLTGGALNLELGVAIGSECGQMDKVTLAAEGTATAVAEGEDGWQ